MPTSSASGAGRLARATDEVPVALRLEPEYEAAEAEALRALSENGPAVRQMRGNLRRSPALEGATREQVDGRVLGVLVALNRDALPQDDLDVMADLEIALDLEALECDSNEHWLHSDKDIFAAWEYGAVTHAAQMAEYRETSPQERLHLLFMTPAEELAFLREEVREYLDQMCQRASIGRMTSALWDAPWLIRHAAPLLVEWIGARLVHPPESRMAERYFSESLAHLHFACMHADVKRAEQARARRNEIGALVDRLMGRPRVVDRPEPHAAVRCRQHAGISFPRRE